MEKDSNYLIVSGIFDYLSVKVRETIDKAAEKGTVIACVYSDECCINELATKPHNSEEDRLEAAFTFKNVEYACIVNSKNSKTNIPIVKKALQEYMKEQASKKEVEKPKYKVSVVIGTFDLMHNGHRQNLAEAHKYGEKLYAFVKSDQRVEEHKKDKNGNPVKCEEPYLVRADHVFGTKGVDGVEPYLIDHTREIAIDDVKKWYKENYGKDLTNEDICVVFGEDLKEKETGKWPDGVATIFTSRPKYNMEYGETVDEHGNKVKGKGRSSTAIRARLKEEGEGAYNRHIGKEKEAIKIEEWTGEER